LVKRIIRHKVTHGVSLAIGLLITAFILMIVIFKTDFFADSAGGMFSRYLFSGTEFSLEIGKLSGNPLKHIEVRDFRIRYHGDEFSYDIVRIERIELKYSAGSLVSGTPRFSLVELDSPHVWIKPDSTGINIIPHMDGAGGGELPVFSVDRFVLRDGQVIFQKPERADALKDVGLEGAVDSDGRIVHVDLTGGGAEDIRRDIFLRDVTGTIDYVHKRDDDRIPGGEPGEIYLDSLFVELDESSFIAGGNVDPDSMIFDLHLDAFPLDVEEITKLADVKTSHFGELQGPVSVKGTPDRFSVDAVFNGIFSGYALEDFELKGEWSPPLFRLDRGEGKFNGAHVAGSGFYTFENPQMFILDIEADGLDLSQGFSSNASLPETDINGHVKLTYYTDTSLMLFDCELGAGHIREFPFETAVIKGSYSPDSLGFGYIAIDSPTHRIRSHGSLNNEDLRIYVDVTCAREDTLFRYLGIEEYSGDVSMNLVIGGSFDEWELRGNGSFSDFRYNRAVVPEGELKLVVKKKESYRVQVELTGDSCWIDPLAFSGLEVSLEYFDDITTFKRLFLTRPGFEADMRGEVRSPDGSTEIEFSEVLISALEEQWRSNGKFTVGFSEEGVEFDDLQLHSRSGALYLDCSIDEVEDLISGVLTFERGGASLLNAAGLIKAPIHGTAKGTVTLSGVLSDPGVDIDMTLVEGQYDTMRIDTMRLRASYAEGLYTIDEYTASSPLGGLGLNGRLKGCAIRELLRDGREALRGYTVDLEASCEDLSLAPFLGFSRNIPFTSGFFTGKVAVSDSLVHPTVDMVGSVRQLSRKNLSIPFVDIEARLEGDRVRLSGDIKIINDHGGKFAGRIPIVKEDWFYSIDMGGNIYLEMYIPSGPLNDIIGVSDLVAEANGKFSAGFKIEGPITDPVILGNLRLEKAGFRPAGMEERFRDVNANILLQDTLITIQELKGKEGKDGSFSGRGRIGLSGWRPESYNIDLKVDKCLFASVPNVMAIASGGIHIGTDMVEGRPVPSLTGDLEVNRTEVYLVMDELTSGTPSGAMTPSLLALVDLEIPGNAWIKTPDASIEMRGDITLHHDTRGTYLRGKLDLVRGYYNVYGNKFKVSSGHLEFVHAGGFRPLVDIEAETLDPEGRKIFLSLLWMEDDVEPKVTLVHEDPGYSETDIWKMLGGGLVDSPGGQESWDAIGTAQNLAANYIERALNSQMQGITIELETEATQDRTTNGSEQKQTMVAVGKYLSEGLYVKYRQGLAISTVRQIEVEYRISRLFLLRTQLIKHSDSTMQGESSRSTDEYNVDLKLRWEF
jgi:hypothetical protein